MRKINETLLLTEDEFWTLYTPIPAADGGMILDLWEVQKHDIPGNHVWTVVDSPCGPGITAIPGIHIGGFGFCVTQTPWPQMEVEAKWLEKKEGQGD